MAITLPSGFDPATYNSASYTGFTLGAVYTASDGKLYRFVKVVTAAGADGVVFVYSGSGTGATQVLGCNRGGIAGACAGVGVGIITINNHGFILAKGQHTNVLGVATVTAGRLQKASGTNDSGTDVTNAYDPHFGTAITALSGGRYTVEVNCL